jgi:hypothetical protein
VVIPSFWLITFYNLKTGHIPASHAPFHWNGGLRFVYRFITLLSYVIVAAPLRFSLTSSTAS